MAEGAYHGLVDEDKAIVDKEASGKDELKFRGVVNLALFMKGDLGKYAAKHHNVKLTIKYLDPRHVIRARAPNSNDVDRCHKLAYCASHSAMAGWTDFAIGHVRNQPVMIPLDVLTNQATKKLSRTDTDWQRVLMSTGQSNFLSRENYAVAIQRE